MANGNSSLIQNLDKIAYGAAAALGLVILAVAFLSGANLRSATREVSSSINKIRAKSPTVPEMLVPNVEGDIERQWKLASRVQASAWSTHRRPSFVQFLKAGETEYIAHQSDPVVEQIEFLRDAEKFQTYVKVTGSLGEINFTDSGAFSAAALERREGEDGQFVPVRGFDVDAAVASGKFEYEDYGVGLGKVYAYRVSSTLTVKGDNPNAKVKPDESTKMSAELVMDSSVPFDYSINVINVTPYNVQTGAKGSFFGAIKYADFKNGGDVKTINAGEFRKDYTFGPSIGGKKKMWKIWDVKPGQVLVRDSRSRKKKVHSSATNNEAVELPERVTAPEPVAEEPEGEDEEALLGGGIAEESEADTTATPVDEPKPEPKSEPTPKKRRGFRRR